MWPNWACIHLCRHIPKTKLKIKDTGPGFKEKSTLDFNLFFKLLLASALVVLLFNMHITKITKGPQRHSKCMFEVSTVSTI